MLDRIRRAYAALHTKAPASPLDRLHPEVAGREHVLSSRAAAEAAVDSYAAGAKVYRVYAWVRKAIAMKAAAIAPLPVRVVDVDGRTADSPLNALLAQPNDQTDSAELWATAFTHKDLAGEWFLEVVDDARGRPRELWARRPDHVQIAPDERRPVYPAPAGYAVEGIEGLLLPTAIVHERYLNPLSDWRGLGPMTAIANDVALDLFALGYAKTFFANSARPDYAVETAEALTPDERRRVEAEIDDKYSPSGTRSGKPIVLETGQRISVLSWPLKDLALLDLREPNRQAVGAIFGVPDEIMGFGKDTYENFDTALKVFWLLTLLPMVQQRDSTLTGFFTLQRPILAAGQRIATDLTSVSVLQEALGPKLEQAARLWAMGVPFDRIDEVLKLGIGAIPGGDVGYLPMSLVPAPEAAAPAPLQRAAKAGRPQIARALQRTRRQLAPRMEQDVERYFANLADRAAARALAQKHTSNGAPKGGAPPFGAPLVKAWPAVADLLLPTDEDLLRTLFQTYTLQICEASWETWNSALDADLGFARTDPAVAAATAQSGERVADILDYTRTALRAVLAFGAEQGWTIDQLVTGVGEDAGIRDVVAETYRGRARTIARTELGTAQQVCAVARYEAAGVARVTVLDGGGEDSDDVCTRLNGTVQTLAWAKANPLQHPNCVRAFAPYFE